MNKSKSPLRHGAYAAATALTAIAAVAAAAFGLHSGKAEATAPAAEPQAMAVPVATVLQSNVSAWDEFSGRLEAVEHVEIRSRAAGTVQAVHFREGALVKK